ncbi:MAG: alkaline phosphatase family protein [Acidobacteria bacterium]|nr:alkaline phosphatase family protein [Acidobacteriota bacterium]
MKRLLAAATIALAFVTGLRAQQPPARTELVIVVDGLRPDYVTPEVMPRLYRLGQRGIVFRSHHSVFPTVTRVNASSFVTGAYPETHGLMGNTIYSPKANATKGLDTGERANLESVERADGVLLTAPTLSEILKPAGKTLLAVSSGSSGSAYLLNHTQATGGIVHYDFAKPQALAVRALALLGPPPAHATPNDPQNQYAIDAYLKVGLGEVHPDVTFMWLNDPDGTAHANGIGAELTLKSLSLVDAGIGRVEDALRARGLLDRTNIIVTSDHGFSTHTRELRLAALVDSFARPVPDGSKDIVVAEGSINLRSGRDPARVAAIVAALQKRPEVGAIFTRPVAGDGRGEPRSAQDSEGAVTGTLSFDVARWNHARAGEILVSANWTNDKNDAGWPGKTTDGGVAGHGTSSPYDIHNTLIAAGPDFREHAVSDVPTANVDIAPTLLHLMGMKPAPTMTGRVIEEGLRTGPSPASVRVERVDQTVKSPDGAYELTAHVSIAAGKRYLDSTNVVRR